MKVPKTLLLVDDEIELLESLKELFENYGYRVLTAANGQEALKLLEELDVDFLVSDYEMPYVNGGELIQKVLKEWPSLPCAIFSATQVNTNVPCFKKPTDLRNLLKYIEETLKKSQ